ncbi:MAG: AAA family ATPase [Planctomycetota bacterium]|nr:AAA family ATPase [Planctomycetota bacterium]
MIRKLGEGGMGSVSLVEDSLSDGRLLALKIIRTDPENPMVLELLRNEFEALAALRHPNIASAYDYGTMEGKGENFFTSEYVDGINFYDGTEGIPLDQKLELLVQVARALEFVHSRGFIHHDLKPDNILISGGNMNRTVKLIDFGLINREFLKTKSIVGTPHYMAPEKIRGMSTDRRVDIYAMGVVTYLLFTRRLPFVGTDAIKVVRKHLVEAPLPPRVHVPDLDEGIEEIILKLLAKDPADRYFTGSDIIRDINKRLGKNFEVETAASQESYIVSGRFVGRDSESKKLQDLLDAVRQTDAPQGSCTLIRGKSGIGKSRLMREFRYYVQLRGVPFLEGNCSRAATTSLHPFYGIFREVIPLSSKEILNRPEYRRELSRLLPDVFPRETQDEAVVGLQPGEDNLRLVHTLAEFILDVSRERPLVVYVNDLQWGDEVTVDLFLTLARRLSLSHEGTREPYRMVLAASFRVEDLPGTPLGISLERAGPPSGVEVLQLESLTEDGVRELVSSMFGMPEVPALFSFHLHGESGGNPLFIEEVMKVLLEEGKLNRSGSDWEFPITLDDVRLPKTLSDVLLNRVRRLEGEEAGVLRFLSVLDRSAPAFQISSLMRAPSKKLATVLRSLEQRQMLDAVVGSEAVEYSFTHNQVKEVLYLNLDDQARSAIHEEVGVGLEALYEDKVESNAVEIAYHYLRSPERKRAVRYGMIAGERLYGLHAYRESETVFRQVLEKLKGAEFATKAQILGRLADMALLTAEYRAGIDSMNLILDTGKKLLNWKSHALVLVKIANLHIRAGEPDEAIVVLEQGLKDVSTRGDTMQKVRLLATLGQAHLRKGNPTECLESCDEAAVIAEAVGRGHTLGSIHNTAGMARYGVGQYPEALEEYKASFDICTKSQFRQGVAASHSNIGVVHLEQGEDRAAEGSFQEAVRIFEEIGDRRSLALGQQNLSDLYLLRGELLPAVKRARKSLRISEEINDASSLGKSLTGYGKCLTSLGEYGEANDVLARALDWVREAGDPREICRALIAAAGLQAVWSQNGDRPELTEALQISRDRGWPYLEGLCLLQMGDESSLEAADEIFRRLGAQREIIFCGLRRANIFIQRGDPTASDPILQAAEGLAGSELTSALGMALHWSRGRWLAIGDAGMDDYMKALEIARATSARPHLIAISADMIQLLRERGDTEASARIAADAGIVLEEVLRRMPPSHRNSFLQEPSVRLVRIFQPASL